MGIMKSDKNGSSVNYNVITGHFETITNKFNYNKKNNDNVDGKDSFGKIMFNNTKPVQRPMTANPLNFDSLEAKNLKSYIDMQAFDGLNSLTDNSAQLRERKKKERECFLKNSD